jgi:phosphate-selective porin OprO and OprP
MHLPKWLASPLIFLASALAGGAAGAQEFGDIRTVNFELDNYFVPDPAVQGDYNQLWQRLQATEARLQQLEQAGTTTLHPMDHPPVRADGNPRVPSAEQRISALESAIGATRTPHYPSVRLTGFFHLDAGAISQDPLNRATLGDIQDGVGFRRARLQAVGNISEFTTYSLEMDFATAGRPSFMDVWGEQQHLPFLGNLRIGHFRQPLSMDSLTSIRQLEFLERSLPFQAFDPFRRVGIMAYDKSDDEMWSWAYGLYRTGGFNNAPLGDTRFGTDIGDQGGFSGAGRVTRLLYYDEPAEGRYLLHVGGHYNYSRMTASTANPVPFYQAQAIPEFFVGDPAGGGLTVNGIPPFVNTGRLAADQFHYFGLQLAGQYGSAHVQGEYLATAVNQIGNPQVYYDGAYVQGGYFLTGENRTYNRMFGVFDRVVPHTDFFALGRQGGFCGWGAWELTGRWSYVNLNDPDAVPMAVVVGPPPTPDPGRLHNSTLGINWYWNAYAKMQFNWIHAFLDNAATGDSDADFFAGRFQVEF